MLLTRSSSCSALYHDISIAMRIVFFTVCVSWRAKILVDMTTIVFNGDKTRRIYINYKSGDTSRAL